MPCHRRALVLASAALLAGCGADRPPRSARPAYAGPMHLPVSFADRATVTERAGAAARALECDGDPYDGGSGSYDDGLATVQGHPETALVDFLAESGLGARLPGSGYRVERRDGARALLSYDVGGRTKAAFIAADGTKDFNGDTGWGVETWAQCDAAELPAAVTDRQGIGVWEDRVGHRVPITRVQSLQGAEHCGWQDVTFLLVGPEEDADWYVRDTTGELADLLRTSYDASATLPDGARDTGWRRDGRALWLTADAAYLVGDGATERWPRAKRPVTCA